MIGWLKGIFHGKQRMQPTEVGAALAVSTFTDWPKEVSHFRSLIEPQVPSDDETFEVEAATLECFVSWFVVSRKSEFATTDQQMDGLNYGLHQTAAELLGQQGWTRAHFESWNRIREDRYNEYARLIEEDKSPASPKLGFAFVRRVIPGVKDADLVLPGLKVGNWTGGQIVAAAETLKAKAVQLAP